jgi:hypothetical protein
MQPEHINAPAQVAARFGPDECVQTVVTDDWPREPPERSCVRHLAKVQPRRLILRRPHVFATSCEIIRPATEKDVASNWEADAVTTPVVPVPQPPVPQSPVPQSPHLSVSQRATLRRAASGGRGGPRGDEGRRRSPADQSSDAGWTPSTEKNVPTRMRRRAARSQRRCRSGSARTTCR